MQWFVFVIFLPVDHSMRVASLKTLSSVCLNIELFVKFGFTKQIKGQVHEANLYIFWLDVRDWLHETTHTHTHTADHYTMYD